MDLILVGFMGSGKTTVSHLLAPLLGLDLCDLDEEVVTQTKKTIPELFEAGGEDRFRQAETSALATVLNRSGILATGGGTVIRAENREMLSTSPAPVVWLKTSAKETKHRLGEAEGRPLAAEKSQADLARMIETRLKAYEEVADLVVETDGLTPAEVADRVAAFYVDYWDLDDK